ncbi:MAG TPA: putative toxin-antitoxin system toxin component, PIN family [Burkholderiales bacterium]|nr:putative toxin-antitoxin system toxin component, PIN family [Burkholderiales bacterium]
MRIFLDTNVLVSAFATRGLCSDLFELILLEHDLVTGRHVLDELSRSLRRKLKLPASNAREIVEFVSGEASRLSAESRPSDAIADAADARVLGEALATEAELFVTGDAALLKLRALEGMKIVSPRGLWEMLRTHRN